MSSSVRAWMPLVDGGYKSLLVVPFKGLKMERQEYREALEEVLKELMSKDPEAARRALQASPEHQPEFDQIAILGSPRTGLDR